MRQEKVFCVEPIFPDEKKIFSYEASTITPPDFPDFKEEGKALGFNMGLAAFILTMFS